MPPFQLQKQHYNTFGARRQWRDVLPSALVVVAAAALVWQGVAALEYKWRWRRIPAYFLREDNGEWVSGPLLDGLLMTLQISALGALGAMVFGVCAVFAMLCNVRSLNLIARFYTGLMRGTPLLVQLYLFYFMFGNVFGLGRTASGVLVLALFEGAFAAEIIRAGIAAVPRGQTEAALALNLRPFAKWRRVLLPQAAPVILPPLANLCVSLIKHSSIVTVIAVNDLTNNARNLATETFLTFEIWFAVGAVYVLLCFPAARAVAFVERRMRAWKPQ